MTTTMTTILTDDDPDLSVYLNRFVTVLLVDYSLVEGKMRRVLSGGMPTDRFCIIGTDGKFVRAGRKILEFASSDVFALIADGWLRYIRAKVPGNGDGPAEGGQGGKD